MNIKLQPDQVTQFWGDVKKGMIESYEIPEEFQQDFAIDALCKFLTGMAQCWIGMHVDDNGNRELYYIMTSRIINEEYHGNKSLLVDSFYSLMPLSEEALLEAYNSMDKFAKENKCNCITCIRNEGTEKLLNDLGFKVHKIIYKKHLL